MSEIVGYPASKLRNPRPFVPTGTSFPNRIAIIKNDSAGAARDFWRDIVEDGSLGGGLNQVTMLAPALKEEIKPDQHALIIIADAIAFVELGYFKDWPGPVLHASHDGWPTHLLHSSTGGTANSATVEVSSRPWLTVPAGSINTFDGVATVDIRHVASSNVPAGAKRVMNQPGVGTNWTAWTLDREQIRSDGSAIRQRRAAFSLRNSHAVTGVSAQYRQVAVDVMRWLLAPRFFSMVKDP